MNDLDKFGHYQLLFPGKYVKAGDLQGRDVTVTIERIDPKYTLEGRVNGKYVKEQKPLVYFRGKDKGWVLNVTNAETIAQIHGVDPRGWIGKQITIYPTMTQAGRGEVPCIRVRKSNPTQQGPMETDNGGGDDLPPDDDYPDEY